MRCKCPERARCAWVRCPDYADWTVWQPRWGERPEGPKFMCDGHLQVYRDAMTKPIKGIDRPADASEDWRSSLSDMMHHASIARSFENRDDNSRAPVGELERHTPAQLKQLAVLCRHLRP